MTLVSVIIPTYNSEKTISDTINSILIQTYSNIEVLITDDNSSDKTVKLIEKIKKSDKRIKLFRFRENFGAGVARNNSIKKAIGKYIAFCDSDDLWKIDKLEKQIQFMKKNKLYFTFSSYDVINEAGEFIRVVSAPKYLTYSDLLKNNYIGCVTAIYDSEKLGKMYMSSIRKRQDWTLWLRIMKILKTTLGQDESLAYYRDRSNSISSNKIQMIKYNWKVYKDELDFGNLLSFLLLLRFLYYYFKKKINE